LLNLKADIDVDVEREELNIADIPSDPGSYALHLIVREPVCAVIGHLGKFAFPAGDYLYLGSAHGPGGLGARLRHHERLADRPHWHLDWLRPLAHLMGGWYAVGEGALECGWSQAVACLPGATIPAPGFGAADCRNGCAAHLIAFSGGMEDAMVEKALGSFLGSATSLERRKLMPQWFTE
jgi:Uri superfamily endonuclease